MLEIKHTLCPSCSAGCGINVVLNDGEIVDTFPYKRHPVNAGKNCLNGRNSIERYKNKFTQALISNSEGDIDSAIDAVLKELASADCSDITVICSGNNSVEEVKAIKDFAESKNYNIGFYADNLKDFGDVASYEDIENASSVFVIGDLLYENPLIGRRIVHAKQNGAKIYGLTKNDGAVSLNIADEIFNCTVSEFLDSIENMLEESSVVVFNYVDDYNDLEQLEKLNCKVLPVFSKSNTKGTFDFVESKSKEEIIDLLDNTKVLLIFNDDIADEIEFDYHKISKVISFAECENESTKISDIVIPIKTWLEKDGSFVNAMGDNQNFSAVVESDRLSEIEIIERLKG